MALGYASDVRNLFGISKFDTMEELDMIRRKSGDKRAYAKNKKKWERQKNWKSCFAGRRWTYCRLRRITVWMSSSTTNHGLPAVSAYHALVRSNYPNIQKGIKRESMYLEQFFRNLLIGENNELRNRFMIVNAPENMVTSTPTSLARNIC